jgi:uncharacterized membrane protein YidH (DUF202 family)
MFTKDADKIKQKFQVACLLVCGLFNGFVLWQVCGFSPFGWISAVPLTFNELTISWLMLPFCLAVSFFSSLFVYFTFKRTKYWGKLFLVLLVGFNLSYLILSIISYKTVFAHVERQFAEPAIFVAVTVIVNLVSLIPTIFIWLLSLGLSKFFTPKTLH